ncbi:MAG: hypothetical protein WDO69_35200 [Pseudomonadota bacterium]
MTRARSFGLVWPYAAAAALGYLLGTLAATAFASLAGGSSSTPLARVGFALRADPHAPPAAWSSGLGADVQAVRAPLASQQREVFDLVVAVRGLDNAGNSDWTRAEQICRGLAWPRCDPPALAQLKEQSRP